MSEPTRQPRPIAIFDSGIGGLPYLEAARARLGTESFVYLGDRAGFPYGSKSREEVRDRVLGIVDSLVSAFGPKALVIACNTASQAGLEAAREAHPGLPIIGTVPAVKPAVERSRSGVVGLIGSAGCVEDPYLDALVARYAKGVEVVREGAQALVFFVERRAAVALEAERREAVAPFVKPLIARGVDEIVLACTHFLHVGGAIAAEAGPGVGVIDSREGVVRRLVQVLAERGLLAAGTRIGGKDRFVLTGQAPFEEEYFLLAEAFGLSGPEPLPG
jgi:glutamate racemase